MMGATHRIFGAACGAAYAQLAGADTGIVVATAIIASASSHGWTSPDMDQTGPWVAFNRLTPPIFDPLLAHRRLSHWWGLPLLAWWGILQLPDAAAWPFLALLVGWVSHLVGDAIFGKVPVMPWGGLYVGLGFKTGGFLETGKLHIFGKERRIIPLGPTKLTIAGGLIYLLVAPWAA